MVPLPKKSEAKSAGKTQTSSKTEVVNLAIYQTLFQEQLGSNEGKTKTGASVESGYDRLYSLKTEVTKKV